MESRFGPHFSAVEDREVDKVIAAFALDALRAVRRSVRVLPVKFVRVCIVILIVSFGLSYVRTQPDVVWRNSRAPNGPELSAEHAQNTEQNMERTGTHIGLISFCWIALFLCTRSEFLSRL